MPSDSALRLFVVVEVAAGVAVDAQCFQDIKAAYSLAASLRRGRNLEEDDVQIIETKLQP